MKKIKSIVTSCALVLFSVAIFGSCGEKIECEDVGPEFESYLSVSPDKPLSEFTSEDWNILKEAKSRLDITVGTDGFMVIKQRSGYEVNISEELFGTIYRMVESGNKKLAELSQTRSGTLPDDCVACCIIEMDRKLGGSTLQYDFVARWIYNNHDTGGVPIHALLHTVNTFLVATLVGVPISTASFGMGPIMAIILGRHAVVVEDLYGNEVLVFDPQAMRHPELEEDWVYFVPYSDITFAIQATATR